MMVNVVEKIKDMKKLLFVILILFANLANAQNADLQWTATWSTAPEQIGQKDMPKESLSDRSLREIVHVSIGGSELRLKLTNEFSKSPVEIKSVYIADAAEGWNIDVKTAKYLTFSGKKNVTIEPGQALFSDALKYDLKPLQRLSITINYGSVTPEFATCHRGSRTTSYILTGTSKPKSDFSEAENIDKWYNISSIDVMAAGDTPVIVALGNSITDGNGTTTNMQNRWTDFMAEAYGGKASVLNLGIGASSMVRSNAPACGALRFDRDVLGQSAVKSVIVFYGVNDIGESRGRYEEVANDLIKGYQEFIRKAHNAGIKIYLATITPIGDSFYYSHFHEATRKTVNDWIRNCKDADGVIDFDAAVRDSNRPEVTRQELTTDHLHLNPKGYELLGNYAHDCLTGN